MDKVNCPNCGEQTPSNSKFCQICGRPLGSRNRMKIIFGSIFFLIIVAVLCNFLINRNVVDSEKLQQSLYITLSPSDLLEWDSSGNYYKIADNLQYKLDQMGFKRGEKKLKYEGPAEDWMLIDHVEEYVTEFVPNLKSNISKIEYWSSVSPENKGWEERMYTIFFENEVDKENFISDAKSIGFRDVQDNGDGSVDYIDQYNDMGVAFLTDENNKNSISMIEGYGL